MSYQRILCNISWRILENQEKSWKLMVDPGKLGKNKKFLKTWKMWNVCLLEIRKTWKHEIFKLKNPVKHQIFKLENPGKHEILCQSWSI